MPSGRERSAPLRPDAPEDRGAGCDGIRGPVVKITGCGGGGGGITTSGGGSAFSGRPRWNTGEPKVSRPAKVIAIETQRHQVSTLASVVSPFGILRAEISAPSAPPKKRLDLTHGGYRRGESNFDEVDA